MQISELSSEIASAMGIPDDAYQLQPRFEGQILELGLMYTRLPLMVAGALHYLLSCDLNAHAQKIWRGDHVGISFSRPLTRIESKRLAFRAPLLATLLSEFDLLPHLGIEEIGLERAR